MLVDVIAICLIIITVILLFGRTAVLGAISGVGGILLLLLLALAVLVVFVLFLGWIDKNLLEPIGKYCAPITKKFQKWEKWYLDLGAFKQYGVFALSVIVFFLISVVVINLIVWVQGII